MKLCIVKSYHASNYDELYQKRIWYASRCEAYNQPRSRLNHVLMGLQGDIGAASLIRESDLAAAASEHAMNL
jgi:hypothetical protein